jgi:hypothetical protein
VLRCARIPALPDDASERAFGMLLRTDAGPPLPPTPVPPTVVPTNGTSIVTQKGYLGQADSAIESTWECNVACLLW